MKLGFSLLSLFMKDVNEMLDIAVENGFDSVELLAEGPLETRKSLKYFTHMTWISTCMQ